MSSDLLATKFFAPPLPAHGIARPRLTQHLDAGLSRKLTLVCAAAGFGKSTLISQWAQDCPFPSAWLSLDAQDRDPKRFLDYLVTSLERMSQTVGAGLATLLRGSPPASAETVLTLLVNQLTQVPGKLVLVLDDYHLAASSGVNEAMAFLLDHLPTQLHLVIASREEPALALGRLRVNGQLAEIRQQDLRFDLDEAAAFYQQDGQVRLSMPQVQALEARTEGWISGLKLAALSLHGQPDPSTFITTFTGSHHFVQDYLVEEVLRQQPAAVQTFLLHTSVLDRLCGPLCDVLLQGHGGEAMLHQLDHAGLFIVPLDTERRWYRYHHLFADLLRQRLLQTQAVAPLHRRACQWYEAQGLELEAFVQATLANDMTAAMRLIAGNGLPLYFRGVTSPLVHWLSSLTPAVLNSQPFLWVVFAWSLLFAGQPGQLEEKLAAADAALPGVPPDATTSDTHGQIAILRAWLAVYRNDSVAIYAQTSRALELLQPQNRPACTAAHCALGVAYMFRGERAQARAAFAEVMEAGFSSGNVMFYAVAATALAGIQATEYQLHAAAATYRAAIQTVGDPRQVLSFEAHLGLAKILYDWNALDEAKLLALRCTELVALANSQSEMGADLLGARLLSAKGEHQQAQALLARAPGLSNTGTLTDRLREASELRVLQLLRSGDVGAAADLARAHQLPTSLARTLLAQGQGAASLRVIEGHRRSLQSEGRSYEALQAMLLESIVHDSMGHVGQALPLLRACIVLAQPQGSIRLFVDEGEPMHALLGQLRHETGIANHIAQLLAAFGTVETQAKPFFALAAASSSHLPLSVFSQRELEILRLIQEWAIQSKHR